MLCERFYFGDTVLGSRCCRSDENRYNRDWGVQQIRATSCRVARRFLPCSRCVACCRHRAIGGANLSAYASASYLKASGTTVSRLARNAALAFLLIFGNVKSSGCVHPAMLVHILSRRLQNGAYFGDTVLGGWCF